MTAPTGWGGRQRSHTEPGRDEGTLWGAFVASGFGVRSLTAAPSGRRCHLRPRARESLAILRFALLRARSMANSSRAVSSSFAALAASACTVTRRVNSSSAVAREESSAELAAIYRSLHRSDRPGPPRADRSARPGPPRAPRSAPVSYTHLRAHETVLDLVCRL